VSSLFPGRLPRRQWRPLVTLADRVFASDSTVRRRRGFRHYFSVLSDFKGLRGGKFPPRSAKRPLAGGTISTVGPCGGRNKGGDEQTVARILLTRKKNRHIPFRRNSALASYDLSILIFQNGKSARRRKAGREGPAGCPAIHGRLRSSVETLRNRTVDCGNESHWR
jgi:hypothetical protein